MAASGPSQLYSPSPHPLPSNQSALPGTPRGVSLRKLLCLSWAFSTGFRATISSISFFQFIFYLDFTHNIIFIPGGLLSFIFKGDLIQFFPNAIAPDPTQSYNEDSRPPALVPQLPQDQGLGASRCVAQTRLAFTASQSFYNFEQFPVT